jgi:hypothetical protein
MQDVNISHINSLEQETSEAGLKNALTRNIMFVLPSALLLVRICSVFAACALVISGFLLYSI